MFFHQLSNRPFREIEESYAWDYAYYLAGSFRESLHINYYLYFHLFSFEPIMWNSPTMIASLFLIEYTLVYSSVSLVYIYVLINQSIIIAC